MSDPLPPLPIDAVLPELLDCLQARDEAVIVAPPGAGKTTRVPLALLDAPWLAGRRLLMLEPRRLATRSAAHHMAGLLGQAPGETVGWRMRLDTRVGVDTRIEVISEGVLNRLLQRDPSLAGVGAVIFDEYHERNLEADLALALCLQGRALFRDGDDPLKLLVMSATLDGAAVAGLLDDAPVIRSVGRRFPVEVIHSPPAGRDQRLVPRVVVTVMRALAEHPRSNVLVFLPGQAEIRAAAEQLTERLAARDLANVRLHPLYGQLSMEAQQRAIAPPSEPGQRKVVLATNIAETSLTIDGVDVVVDSGRVRAPAFDPGTGMTRLVDTRISKASSEQRAGRAGRVAPGHCYRLWTRDEHQQLPAQSPAEILSADLAPLALQLLHWGANDPSGLRWLDAPPAAAWQQALDLLARLGALEQAEHGPVLSAHGRRLATLPVHPRLGHLLLHGQVMGCVGTAARLAAILADGQLHAETDLARLIDMTQGGHRAPGNLQGWKRRIVRLAQRFERQLPPAEADHADFELRADQTPGALLALAYPDRIARRDGAQRYRLANGRGVVLPDEATLTGADWLAVAVTSGRVDARDDVIRAACQLDPALFETLLSELVTVHDSAGWDASANRFVAERRGEVGALVLWRRPLRDVAAHIRRRAVLDHIAAAGLELLPWTPALRQWQGRVQLLRRLDPAWPDVSDAALSERLDDWLGPWLDGVATPADIRALDLGATLRGLLPWELTRHLDELAPTHVQVPSGSNVRLDYSQDPPVLAVKLQEMFGCDDTPCIAGGRLPVMVHLLSPAGRPLQVTQDLAGFWRGGYQDVRREMRGRYPKHPWPEDPLGAQPTARTRGR